MSQQQVQGGRRLDNGSSRLTQWTSTDRLAGRYSCYAFFALAMVYVTSMLGGFIDGGGLSAPIRDPYLAVMEVLTLLLAVAIVVAFAALHAYAPASKKTLSLSALVMVALMAGITICVHFILLTVGRQADESTLPGSQCCSRGPGHRRSTHLTLRPGTSAWVSRSCSLPPYSPGATPPTG